MAEAKKVIGALLGLRDSKLTRFGIPGVLDAITRAKEIAGITVLTLWPNFDQKANARVINHCRSLGIKPLLWYPVLADNDIVPDREEVTENAWGTRGLGRSGVWEGFGDSEDTYLFACPRPSTRYNQLVLAKFKKYLKDYDGAVIDNVRLPTPANGVDAFYSCFCPVCLREEPRSAEWRLTAVEVRRSLESLTDKDLEDYGTLENAFQILGLSAFLRSRENTIVDLVKGYSEAAREEGKEFAVSLLTPGLAMLAGQDYDKLTALADWVRPLILCRASCPSGLRVEITSMLKGMMAWSGSLTPPAIMRFISRSTGIDLPEDFYAISDSGLPAATAMAEVKRSQALSRCPAYPAFEFMRENPDYEMDTDERDVATYLKAAESAPGFYMAWNLLYVPDDFLRMAGEAGGKSS